MSEKVLDYLLQNKQNRVNATGLNGKPFQIGVYRHNAGFLVATAYTNDLPEKTLNGLILPKHTILSWLDDTKAEIMEAKV